MENTLFSGPQAASAASAVSSASAAYDYRIYDQVWQRVTPGVDPYGADATAPAQEAAPTATAPAAAAQQAAPLQETGGTATLPGATPNPCCMGSSAQESVEVLEGFIQEELASCRCCYTLSCNIRNQAATQLLRRISSEKQAAAREMCGAYYLITGSRYTPAITVEHMQWSCLAEALRSCYHQEACSGLNYARAADETTDQCLTKLFNRLSEQAYKRAEDVMTLLGKIVC